MRILIILSISLLAACAGTPSQHSTYLLRSGQPVNAGAANYQGDAFLGSITLAPYIDQSGLVLVNANNTIHQAKYHEWAEPLGISLRQYFAAEIGAQLGHDLPPYAPGVGGKRIDIHIDQLHGNASGEAVLVASWQLGETRYRYSGSSALAGDGYDALVTAQKQLLNELASSIAKSLK